MRACAIAPLAIVVTVLAAPVLLRSGKSSRAQAATSPAAFAAGFARVAAFTTRARGALVQLRDGLTVFRRPRLGALATAAQLAAWGVQWLSCYVLLVALGLDAEAG